VHGRRGLPADLIGHSGLSGVVEDQADLDPLDRVLSGGEGRAGDEQRSGGKGRGDEAASGGDRGQELTTAIRGPPG